MINRTIRPASHPTAALRQRNKTAVLFAATSLLFACGGGDNNDDGNGSVDGAPPVEVACNSFALCTSHDVKQFVAEPATPAGGMITDGIYVLAWSSEFRANEVDRVEGSERIDAYLFSGGSFVSTGLSDRGTVSTSGTTLTFSIAALCSLGEENGDDDDQRTFEYTAQGDLLMLYSTVSSGSEEWTRERVYVRRGADSICDTVDSEPTSPGPSASCTVANCYCNVAISGTIDNQTCQ